MDKGLRLTSHRIHNTRIAIKCIESTQRATRSGSVWQQLEDELIDLREKLEKLEHGTT
jgi:hypothetical protein